MGNYREIPSTLCPPQPLSPEGACITVGEPALTRHHHRGATVLIEVRSGSCTFCGFGQVCTDRCPPLRVHAEQCHRPETPLCPAGSSLRPQCLATAEHCAFCSVLCPCGAFFSDGLLSLSHLGFLRVFHVFKAHSFLAE